MVAKVIERLAHVGLMANDGEVQPQDPDRYVNATISATAGPYRGVVLVSRATDCPFGFPSDAMALRMTHRQALALIGEIAAALAEA
jgi:hypothetical protein